MGLSVEMSSSSSSGIPLAAIIGVAVGGFVVLLVAIALVLYFCRRRSPAPDPAGARADKAVAAQPHANAAAAAAISMVSAASEGPVHQAGSVASSTASNVIVHLSQEETTVPTIAASGQPEPGATATYISSVDVVLHV